MLMAIATWVVPVPGSYDDSTQRGGEWSASGRTRLTQLAPRSSGRIVCRASRPLPSAGPRSQAPERCRSSPSPW